MLLRIVARLAVLSLLIPATAYLAADSEPNLNPVAGPPDPALLHPVERIPRARFGVVGPFPLNKEDLRALLYPGVNEREKNAVIEGLKFFTTPHAAREGAGAIANQRMCLGCHLNSADAFPIDRKGN